MMELKNELDDATQHLDVLMEAHRLFLDRSQVRGDMWRQFPPSDKVRELRERITRVESAFPMMQMELVQPQNSSIAGIIRADALDIINYAAFLIKQLDEGARG